LITALPTPIVCRDSAMRRSISARTSTLCQHGSCDLKIALAVFYAIGALAFATQAEVRAPSAEGEPLSRRRPD
jgi:hypothetical protein